ncbi:MAG: hypothetical protein SGJ01_14715 [Gemmatimonadota bacterium]|mgnify:CR=1 FL=1|nr:hypothetical protein [Gemmatimonadota bacterium]
MRWIAPAALALGLLAATHAPVAAQRAATTPRHGLWVGAGLGLGSAQLTCSVCRGGRDGGTTGYLRIGTTVGRNVLVGAETNIWYHTAGQVDYLMAALSGVVYLYPRPGSGLYLKTGAGFAQYSAKDNTDKVSSNSLALQVGAGWEILMTRSLSIVPFLNFLGTTGGDVRINRTISGLSANTSLIQLGVGVTLH